MPTFIPRPDFLGDSLARILTERSEQAALKHNEEVADRRIRQSNTLIAGPIVAAIAGDTDIRPAVGTIATVVAAGTGGAAAGSLGAAVNVGARVTASLADRNFAVAAKIGSEGFLAAKQAAENQQFFGGKTTPEGRAAAGRIAERLGTTLDTFRHQGLTATEGLASARDAAAQRRFEGNVGTSLASSAADEIINSERASADETVRANTQRARAQNEIDEMPDRERGVDHEAVTEIEEDLRRVDQDEIDFRRSGGSGGAPLKETLARHDVTGRLRRARRNGPTTRKQPPLTILNSDGTTREIPFASAFIEGGKLMLPKFDEKGNFTGYSTAAHTSPSPSARIPEGSTPEEAKAFVKQETDKIFRDHAIPEDRFDDFFLGSDNVPVQIKPGKEDAFLPDIDRLIFDIRKELTFENDEDEIVTPTTSQIRTVLNQQLDLRRAGRKRVERNIQDEKNRAIQSRFFIEIGRIFNVTKSIDDFARLIEDVEEEYGNDKTKIPRDLLDELDSLAEIFKRKNAPVELPPELDLRSQGVQTQGGEG